MNALTSFLRKNREQTQNRLHARDDRELLLFDSSFESLDRLDRLQVEDLRKFFIFSSY